MNTAMRISELHQFRFGSKVFGTDGQLGVLTQVGFDPGTRRMTHLAIRQGRLLGKTALLPFDLVTDASSDGIYLRISDAEVDTNKSESPGAIFFDSKSVVQLAESGKKGTLFLVAVNPTGGELIYFVVHSLVANQDTLIWQQYVTKLEAGRITIAIPDGTLQSLPAYRPDNQLQRDVESALFDQMPLHIDSRGMHVRVLDGVLYLDGNISSSLRSDVVEDQASGVNGLLEIRNRLVADDTLAADVARALGQDERTRDLPIGVYPRLGVVRLSGAVHNDEQKAAAEEIAGKLPGVRSVINDLVVDPKADILRVLSATEGGETADNVPGGFYVRHTK